MMTLQSPFFYNLIKIKMETNLTFDDIIRNIIKQENNALKESITELLSNKLGIKNKVMNLNEFCTYVGCSRSHAYKLTSNNQVPVSRKNGKLWFKQSAIDDWLMDNPIKTKAQIEDSVTDYLSKRKGDRYEK